MKTTNRKRNISIVIACFLWIFLFCSVIVDYSYASYSPGKAVNYALNNTVDSGVKQDPKTKHNKGWRNPNYYSSGHDCTNFVSQCVVAGGKSFTKPKKLNLSAKGWVKGAMYTDTTSRWYNKSYTYKNGPLKRKIFCYSTSFNQVGKFYKKWEKYSTGKLYKKSGKKAAIAKNSELQNELKYGDIIQAANGDGWYHSMIVTGGSKGNWSVTYHSTDTKNQALASRPFSSDTMFRIIRIK